MSQSCKGCNRAVATKCEKFYAPDPPPCYFPDFWAAQGDDAEEIEVED